ncbi:LmrA/YxaF family transcription factor [Clostridium gasigenes]|uniref:LmrA/YxaF family transcription factor n=1 Tax=Clostridium gasigenes TaxID=94869 RepID=UPI003F4A339C
MLQDISISLLSLETHLLSEPLREACKKAILVMENAYTEKLIESAITVSVGNRDVSALLVVSTQIELLLNN